MRPITHKDTIIATIAKIKALKIKPPKLSKVMIIALKEERWGEIGNNLFDIFATESKDSEIREGCKRMWNAIPKKLKKIIEETK